MLLRPSSLPRGILALTVSLACNGSGNETGGSNGTSESETGDASPDCETLLSEDPCALDGVLCPTLVFPLAPGDPNDRPSILRDGSRLSLALVGAPTDAWILFDDLSATPDASEVQGLPWINNWSGSGAIDLDENGVDDLVIAADQNLWIYPEASTGDPITVPLPNESSEVALGVGDFNGDEVNDLALLSGLSGNGSDRVVVLPGPDLTVAVPVASEIQSVLIKDVGDPLAVGDFDGDGNNDLAFFSTDDDSSTPVQVAYGLGDGHFSAGENLPDVAFPTAHHTLVTLPGGARDLIVDPSERLLRLWKLDAERGTWIAFEFELPWGQLSAKENATDCDEWRRAAFAQVGEWTGDDNPDIAVIEQQSPDACGGIQERAVLHIFSGTAPGEVALDRTWDLGQVEMFPCRKLMIRPLEPGRLYLQADAFGYVFEVPAG